MKRSKNSYLYRTYQLLSSGKKIKEIEKEIRFKEGKKKQGMNYYISPLKKLKYIEKIGYGVWEIKKKWDQKEVDNFLKQVRKYTLIGSDTLQENKDKREIRGHGFQLKLQLPKTIYLLNLSSHF